jgi:osmotically-inducible protein OsmY
LCDYHEGALILRGDVPSYFLKQLAQEAVRGVEGVEEIVNRIQVAY